MVTLEELRRKNEKLRNELKAKEEIKEIGRERNRLLKEQTRLIRQKKFSKVIAAGRIGKRVGKKVGKVTGRVAGKLGIKLGKGLLQIAKNIAENERREKMLEARATRKKSTKRKKTKTRKKRKKR